MLDSNIVVIGSILSGLSILVPSVSWIDTLFGIPLFFIYPSAYIYFITYFGSNPFSLNDFPIYFMILWLTIPLGLIAGLTLEILLIPTFIIGIISAFYFIG